MILLESTLSNIPIMGVQTGSELARLSSPVIDPATLSIVAYVVSGRLLAHHPTYLRIADIRELSDIGVIVDSIDEFVEPGDVIKIDEIVRLQFTLNDMRVRDEKGTNLGKVVDFTIDTGSFYIQQLTVRRPLMRSLTDTELLVHRTQIIEINDKAIVVHSQAKAPEPERTEVVGSYVNPFRKPDSVADTIDQAQS